VVVDWAN